MDAVDHSIVEIRDPAPVAPVAPIPPSIVQAICVVMETMEAVKKSQKNQHGGYMFASTDDIYAAVTAKMGKAGLILLTLEDSPPEFKEGKDKDGKTVYRMRVSYAFVLATKDGTWADSRNRRTLVLPYTGPQAAQAAQSYVEKTYLRSLFKIPTGDQDLDALPEGFEYNPLRFEAKAPPPPPAKPADASLEADRAAVAEMTSLLSPAPLEAQEPAVEPAKPQEPAPDMEKALAEARPYFDRAVSEEALRVLVERFNKTYDGHIGQEIRAKLDVLWEENVARLKKKG